MLTTPRIFWGALLLFLALIFTANRAVHHLARNSLPRQILREIESQQQVDTLFVGNSVVREGVDCNAFDAAARGDSPSANSLNVALGGTTELEHLLLARAALRRHPQVRRVVYGHFDFHLTEPSQTRWWDARGNTALGFYVEPATAVRHLARGPVERAGYHLVRHVPLYVERMGLWSKVERLRRRMGSMGMPSQTESHLGRVADFDALEALNEDEFRNTARQRCAQRTPISRPLLELFEECRGRNIDVVLVEMPLPPRHQQRFYSLPEWGEYRAYLKSQADEFGARYLDATAWVTDPGLFHDAVHLNPTGAKVFSERLARELQKFRTNP